MGLLFLLAVNFLARVLLLKFIQYVFFCILLSWILSVVSYTLIFNRMMYYYRYLFTE